LGRRRARLDNGLIIPNDHSLGTLAIGLCASCTSTSAVCDTKASIDGSAADLGHQIRAQIVAMLSHLACGSCAPWSLVTHVSNSSFLDTDSTAALAHEFAYSFVS
jgi:hypothetical protein